MALFTGRGHHGVELCVSWIPSSGGQIPHNAVAAGHDTFVGRAKFNGELIPGKVPRGHQGCYVSWGGVEHCIKQYEVLCDSGMSCFGQGYHWVRVYGANVPKGALVGGHANADPYYIGRSMVNGQWCSGKVFPPHNCAYFPWGGEEHTKSECEVLVFRNH